jgi:hypothetical protein
MACSSRLRVQGNPIRHKNPSNESKPWIYDEKYCVFKFHGRGDERHSKNGLGPNFRLSNLLDEVKFMQCFLLHVIFEMSKSGELANIAPLYLLPLTQRVKVKGIEFDEKICYRVDFQIFHQHRSIK